MHQPLKEYLEIIEILYKEFEVEYNDFPFAGFSHHKNVEHFLDLYMKYSPYETLMRLEVFMLALLFKPVPAFMAASSQSKQCVEETLDQLENRITELGRELLFVIKHVGDIKKLDGNYFSRNIQILSEFFKYEFERKEDRNFKINLDYDLNNDVLYSLNRLLSRLKAFAESGNLRTDKNLLGLEMATRNPELLNQVILM